MRNLTPAEIDQIDDNGESDEGLTAVETTVAELAILETGTGCGRVGNQCFVEIAKALENPEKHRVIGWFEYKKPGVKYRETNAMSGMVKIECTNEQGALIEQVASEADGSLRFESDEEDPSFKFREFEIE